MSNVYRYAELNIAASIAAISEAGCFPDRSTSLLKPCTVQTAWVDCQNNGYLLYHDDFWNYAFKGMPLMTRAWVVQELLLARKVLHLTGTQLLWECYDWAAYESHPGGVPPIMASRRMSREAIWGAFNNIECGSIISEKGSETLSKDNWRKLWPGIVGTYSACELTYTSDKLVALSGVAKLMERALDDQYCAGLWRNTLVTQLFWSGGCDKQRLRCMVGPGQNRRRGIGSKGGLDS